jgi:hypothetical protein
MSMKILRFFRGPPPEAGLSPSSADQIDKILCANPGDPRPPKSINTMSREDMIHACRRMATKELALAEEATGRGRHAEHIYNAASWSERADLLQRIEDKVQKRKALDRAQSTADQRKSVAE